ncbi:MAG: hypothetical protein RR150_03675, partial [Clostridia bacterium]
IPWMRALGKRLFDFIAQAVDFFRAAHYTEWYECPCQPACDAAGGDRACAWKGDHFVEDE